MKARKQYDVKYPTMYLERSHKNAQKFNSVQRGHQNMIETQASFTLMALFGALYSSNFALANAVGGLCYCLGCFLYAKGYATAEENGKGRYKSGGAIKYIGILTAFGTSIYTALKITNTI